MFASPFVDPQIYNRFTGTVVAAIFLSLAGHLFTQARNKEETEEKRSLFYLKAWENAFEEARVLLSDGNNDRITWIAAARTLGHAKEIEKLIALEPHIRVVEIQKLKYRAAFADALKRPGQFFFGIDDLSVDLDEAAKESTRRDGDVTSSLKAIARKSLYAVWEAAQWPSDFVDTIGTDFEDEQIAGLGVLN